MRNTELSLLHPKLRALVPEVIRAVNDSRECREGGYVLCVFETARTPSRQEMLFRRGRDPNADDYGRTVTDARAYQSAHQFGEGVDLVFRKDGGWTWSREAPWHVYRSEAAARGLVHLSSEQPHVQLKNFSWKGRQCGPADDAAWLQWLRKIVS